MKPAILLVDHGSRRAEANAVLEEIAGRLRRRLPGRIVEIAHMELAHPSVAEGVGACVAAGAREILVHPYFLAPGTHSRLSIPEQVRDALRAHPEATARVGEPLGAHEKLVDVILERIGETSAG